MLDVCAPKPKRESFWLIQDADDYIWKIPRLPKTFDRSKEEEWVVVTAIAEEWPGGRGANLKRVREVKA